MPGCEIGGLSQIEPLGWHQTSGIGSGGKHQASTILLQSNQFSGYNPAKLSTDKLKKRWFFGWNIWSFWSRFPHFQVPILSFSHYFPSVSWIISWDFTSRPSEEKTHIFYESSGFHHIKIMLALISASRAKILSQIIDVFLFGHLSPSWCPKLTLSSIKKLPLNLNLTPRFGNHQVLTV